MSKNNKASASSANRGKSAQKKHAASKKKKFGWLKGTIFASLTLLILAPMVAFLVAYITVDVPRPEELVTKQVSQIFASDKQTELAKIVPAEGNRREVKLDNIAEVAQHAVLAAEDRKFYTNSGFSFTGFGRAILGQLTGNSSAGGGSTITQQYVKNMVVGNDYSYKRKARELVYSVKMAREWSKEQVLEAYLNTIYFGRSAYGIDAAAHAYFGISAKDLNVAQSAVLAAAIQRPSELDPWFNPEESHQRWGYVLDGMVEEGWLSAEERNQMVYPETTDPALNRAYSEAEGTNGLIKQRVFDELAEKGITERDVETLGLTITTTIDPQVQREMVAVVNEKMANQPENLRTAAVSIDPATGAVRGYFGGHDPNGWDYANAGYQTGSTFKIFGYAAALQQGVSPNTYISDSNYTLPDGQIVPAGGCGGCTIAESLKRSLNTPFLRLQMEHLENNTQDVADMAHALGVAKSFPGTEHTLSENGGAPFEGVVLGQYLSRPIDMAHALATLANQGVWHEAYFVEKVETAEGEVLYTHTQDAGQRRVAEVVAANTLKAMFPIAAWSNNNYLAEGRQSASKTGTQQLGDSGLNKDAWMIGATPQLATAVWVGTDDSSPLLTAGGASIYGSDLPATLWKNMMDRSLAGKEVKDFPEARTLPHAETVYNPYAYYSPYTGGTTDQGTDDTLDPAAPVPDGEIPAPVPAPAPVPEAPQTIGEAVEDFFNQFQ